MNDDRDPMLQELFANAEQDLVAEAFVDRISLQTNKLKRRTLAWRIGLGVTFAICAWLLAAPIHDVVGLLTQGITTPLITLDGGQIAVIFSPVNNFASALALSFLGLWVAYRSLFS